MPGFSSMSAMRATGMKLLTLFVPCGRDGPDSRVCVEPMQVAPAHTVAAA